MRFNKTYVDNEFKFLPFVGECSETNRKEKIIKNTRKQTLEDFQPKVAELSDGKDLEFKEKLLKDFDKKFDYLKESSVFEDIYFNYREDYLNILLTALAYHVSRIRTGTTQNIDAYTYIKTKRTNKE